MNANTPNMNASTFIAIRTTNIYLRKLVLRVRLHTLFAATAVRVRSPLPLYHDHGTYPMLVLSPLQTAMLSAETFPCSSPS